MSGWQVKLCDPLAITDHMWASLVMGSSHNRALYKCPITLSLNLTCILTIGMNDIVNIYYILRHAGSMC